MKRILAMLLAAMMVLSANGELGAELTLELVNKNENAVLISCHAFTVNNQIVESSLSAVVTKDVPRTGSHGGPTAWSRSALCDRRSKQGGEQEMARTEYLLHKEVEHVLAALTPSNRLICRVILHTGLRVGDVVSLKKEQIGRQFSVLEAKTGKRRKVGIPDDLRRDILAQAGPVWAFPGRKPGAHKTRQAVWWDMKRAAKAFRMTQNVGTHSLRKVYAVELLRKY